MSRIVYKWSLEPFADVGHGIPEGATLAHVGPNPHNPEAPAIWFLCDPDAPKVGRTFYVAGTGHPVPDSYRHVGSAICGPWAWHVFEVPR